MERKYTDREYETAKYNIEMAILGGIAETAALHGMAYNAHSKPTIDAIVNAVYEKLTFKPILWSLIAVAEQGGVQSPKPR